MQVRGTDYLVPPHSAGTPVTGGVYVFFGWVDSTKKWGPSARNINDNAGNFGVTYLYPGSGGSADSATTDGPASTGYVSFTKTAESPADEVHMDEGGNWTLPIVVPGATFSTTVPGGTVKTTDCRQVTCGIFTIGAHGKASATNEKFIPLRFAGSAGATAVPTTSPSPTVTAAATSTPRPTLTRSPSPSKSPTPSSSPTPSRTAGSGTSSSTNDPDAPGDNGDPLPQTGIADEPLTSASVVRPVVPLDGQTVAVGVNAVQDSGTGGGLALFGVAALAALVMALTAALFWRFRREDPRA